MKRQPSPDALLDREAFSRAVFAASGGACVLCGAKAVDAHHIFERKLFADGGYRLRNGAALCGPCHWDAETGKAGVARVAAAALAPRGQLPLMPPHARALGVAPESLDKWGNLIRADGSLAPGPLFHDDGCRAAMAHGGTLGLCYDAGDFPWAAQSAQDA